MKKKNELLEYVKTMSVSEQKNLVEQILTMLNTAPTMETCNDMISAQNTERPNCPHCHADAKLGYIVKRGFNKSVQRYYCKVCGKVFVATTNTAFSRTRKSADIWCKFIQMTIKGESIEVCATECGLAHQTAFTWRHKILNVFRVNQNSTMMTGRVEIDEMLFPISYKGNHMSGSVGTKRIRKPGESNNMPRDSFARGTDNRSTSSRDKVCVFCMVEDRDKTFYAVTPGVGFMNVPMLNNTIGRHVNKGTAMILSDQNRLTKKYLEDNNYRYMTLLSGTSGGRNSHRPEIVGDLHLQHVNAMHHHIRQFLRKYCGVSSKYLENYISLFVWIKNNKALRQNRKLPRTSILRAAAPDCYIARKEIESWPAVPECA